MLSPRRARATASGDAHGDSTPLKASLSSPPVYPPLPLRVIGGGVAAAPTAAEVLVTAVVAASSSASSACKTPTGATAATTEASVASCTFRERIEATALVANLLRHEAVLRAHDATVAAAAAQRAADLAVTVAHQTRAVLEAYDSDEELAPATAAAAQPPPSKRRRRYPDADPPVVRTAAATATATAAPPAPTPTPTAAQVTTTDLARFARERAARRAARERGDAIPRGIPAEPAAPQLQPQPPPPQPQPPQPQPRQQQPQQLQPQQPQQQPQPDEPARDCAVCLDDDCNATAARCALGCGHRFHVLCARRWFCETAEQRCPMCRDLHFDALPPPDAAERAQARATHGAHCVVDDCTETPTHVTGHCDAHADMIAPRFMDASAWPTEVTGVTEVPDIRRRRSQTRAPIQALGTRTRASLRRQNPGATAAATAAAAAAAEEKTQDEEVETYECAIVGCGVVVPDDVNFCRNHNRCTIRFRGAPHTMCGRPAVDTTADYREPRCDLVAHRDKHLCRVRNCERLERTVDGLFCVKHEKPCAKRGCKNRTHRFYAFCDACE